VGGATATGLGAACIAAGLLAAGSSFKRLPRRRCFQRLVVHAGNDFAGSAQPVEPNNKVSLGGVLGNTANAIEERSNKLRKGLDSLRSAPEELGRKLAQPFVTTATVVSDSAKAVAEVAGRAPDGKSFETARGSVGNLAAIPGVVKSRLIDTPVEAVQRAQDAAGKILGVPGKLIGTAQDSISAVGTVMGRLVALPGRLKERVDGTVSDVQAVAALPGQVSASISSRVSGFAQSVEAAISLPGQALAGIKETMDDAGQKVDSLASGVGKAANSFSNTVDSNAKVPGRTQANDGSIPRSKLQPLSDSKDSVKSLVDDSADKAAKPPSSQEP